VTTRDHWGNLAFVQDDYRHRGDLIRLGNIEAGWRRFRCSRCGLSFCPVPKQTTMQILRGGETSPRQGSADWFTGCVRIDGVQRRSPNRVRGAYVTFESATRTAHASARPDADRDVGNLQAIQSLGS
jgi:hypothetical protein